MKKIFIFCFLLFLVLPSAFALDTTRTDDAEKAKTGKRSSAVEKADCTDDPRLQRFGTLIEEVRGLKKGAYLKDPVMITPEKYIKTKQKFLKLLGDNLIVCPDILFVDGEPVEKIKVDFFVLFQKIKNAAIETDVETIKDLYRNFEAKPLPASAVNRLIQLVDIKKEALQTIADGLGIRLMKNKQEEDIALAAVFAAFAGRIEGGYPEWKKIVVTRDYLFLNPADIDLIEKYEPPKHYEKEVCSALSLIGLDFLQDLKQVKAYIRNF